MTNVPRRRHTVGSKIGSIAPIAFIVVLLLASGALASGSVRASTPEVCIAKCPPSAPTIHAGATVQQGYRQAWVNWSDTGYPVPTITFSWHAVGGNANPVPLFNNTYVAGSVDLNALTAGTTYDYTITATNYVGHATYSGSFKTTNAPTNEFVGWVSQMISDPYELDQIGNAMPGAPLGITAICPVNNSASIFSPYWIYTPTPVNFSATTTNSAGQYTLSFPLSTLVSGPLGTQEQVQLWSTGWCSYTYPLGVHTNNVSNSHYALNAMTLGYWNATDWISSVLSATNDYHQFGLPANEQTYSIPGIAFVHTPYATCGVTVVTSISESINSYDAGNGFTDQTSWGSGASAPPVSNGESEIDFHQYTSGIVNETSGANYSAAWAYGNMFDPSQNTLNVSDPLSPPPPGQTYPILGYPGYQVETIGTTGGGLFWYNGGSYTSTQGLDISVSLTGGWDGISFGPSLELIYTTTTGKSSQTEITCSFSWGAAPTGELTQFYFYVDGSQASNWEAVNVHVWFDDYCVPNGTTCS